MRTIVLEPQGLEGTAASQTTPLSHTRLTNHRLYRELEGWKEIHRVCIGDNSPIGGTETGLLVVEVGREVGRIGEGHGSMAMVPEVKRSKVSIT